MYEVRTFNQGDNMPYPNYTRRERVMNFLDDKLVMVTPFLPSYTLVLGTLALAYYGIIPGWLASPLVLLGWGRANFFFWTYQAWRSSGPRGFIVNPAGPRGSDMLTTMLWLALGVFFHLYHVWLRSNFRAVLLHKSQEDE